MSTDQPTLDESRNRRAHTAAFAAVADAEPTPAGIVTYRSRGKVLVIGGEAAQWLAARIEPPLHAEVLLIDGEAEPGVPLTPLAQRQLQLTGHLGAFTTELGDRGHYNHQRLDADIVVDLSDTPLMGADLPPPGYWHFTSEPADLDAALLAIDGMVGTFEKPRYFAYDADICAHSRAGRSGCRRCIDACPAEAIVSIGERIEVNPNLCQGGGTCATVCPSGAIRYAYPGPGETADRLRRLLLAYRDAGGNRPVIVFTAAEDAEGLPPLPPNLLPLAVEELASVGHELWLTALAWGAQQVVLVDGPGMPPRSRNALGEQLGVVHALLSGMGYPPEAIGLLPPAQVAAATAESRLPAAASFAATSDKRQLAGLALDHLWAGTSTHPEVVALPAGAPYGRIRVDPERCTLCMGCTSVCPAKALSAGDEVPRLDFYEGNCVQCGLCAAACPERAIELDPRYLCEPLTRRRPQRLYEDQPFCCVQCGKPFATQRVIDNILGKLVGHAMFQSERARRRLQMCEDCRVVDAVQDAEAMQSGLPKGNNNYSNNG